MTAILLEKKLSAAGYLLAGGGSGANAGRDLGPPVGRDAPLTALAPPAGAVGWGKQSALPNTIVIVFPRVPVAVASLEPVRLTVTGATLAGGPPDTPRVSLLSLVPVALILNTTVTVHP